MSRPGLTVGILGGGRLGRMLAQAAHRLDVKVVILCPDDDSPAGQVADRVIKARYKSEDALKENRAAPHMPVALRHQLQTKFVSSPLLLTTESMTDKTPGEHHKI